jgi:hypothetical protein
MGVGASEGFGGGGGGEEEGKEGGDEGFGVSLYRGIRWKDKETEQTEGSA